MLNSQLFNQMGDFFTAFIELSKLANANKLESMIEGLSEAKATMEAHQGAKNDLAELARWKETKEKQLQEIEDSRGAVAEASRLNTEHAKALSDATNLLEAQKESHQNALKAFVNDKKAVKDREDAVGDAESKLKDEQAKVIAQLQAAADLKKSYITKLKTIAQTEGEKDVTSSS